MKKPVTPDVVFRLDHTGVHSMVIYADTPDEQMAAYRLLKRVAPQFRALDQAIKNPTPQSVS